MSDDAFITLRAVSNLLDGRSFAFNPDERVLGFTNSLWAIAAIPVYALARDPYVTGIALGLASSACFGAVLVFATRRYRRSACFVLLTLCLSRAFIDFSTSGLENPLTHLLVLLTYGYFLTAARPSAFVLGLAVAVGWINRMDSLLLLVWPLAWVLASYRSRAAWRQTLWGLALIAFYEVTLFFYYGFFLPNTAYAKLNADIPRSEYFYQGLAYLIDSLNYDPITFGILVFGLAAAVLHWRRSPSSRALVTAVGILAHIAYVVWIGGDFMSGRFLTPALVPAALAIVVVLRDHLRHGARAAWFAAGVAFFALLGPHSAWRDEPPYDVRLTHTGIVSERAVYQNWTPLELNFRQAKWRAYGISQGALKEPDVRPHTAALWVVGMFGATAGTVHIIDKFGLTDALLARIPFKYQVDWRPGHLDRPLPDGYIETVEEGRNVIRDRCIAAYYDRLQRVTRGPLWSLERLTSAWTLNLPGHTVVQPCESPR